MEFFEKAHIVKNNEMKNKKTTENVKKQLKQMLYGYKVSDNKIIQNSAEINNDLEDSTSVSGFSDLNLTNSSHDDTHQGSTINENISITDVSENLSSLNVFSDDNIRHTDDSSQESFTENNDPIKSLSEDLSSKDEVSSLGESEISIVSGMLDSSPESDKSEVFDADGSLAAKIFENLELNKKKNKSHKRKHSDPKSSDCHSKKGPKYNHVERSDELVAEVYKNKHEIKPKEVLCFEEETNSSISNVYIGNDVNSNPTSPELVSITASDIPLQSLSEVIGEYTNRTVRKICKDKHDAILKTSKSNIFIEQPMSQDITILPIEDKVRPTENKATSTVPELEDEVCSIIPEVDDVVTAEEIDEEIYNLDTTAQINNDESINNLDNTLQSELISDTEPLIEEDAFNSNAKDTFQLYYGQNCCIIVLKHPSELFIQGKVIVKALGGTMEVFGYTLTTEAREIYAPYYNYAQCIKTVNGTNSYYGLFNKLTSAGLSVLEAESIVTTSGDQDGILLLQPLNKKTMEFVDNNFKIANLFVKPLKNIDPYFIKASDMLNCSLFSICPWQHFVVNPSWKEANEHALKFHSRGIICGGKGTGKSTYLRYQVNKHLGKCPVLVLDLDPGQSEFSPAGSISATTVTKPLLGPSFTHLKLPILMYNCGMINTMDNARLYLSAVRKLISQCLNHKILNQLPWFINTMGMTNVMGLKFMIYIIILSNPTYLVQYESKNNKRRFDSLLRATTVKLLYLDYQNDYLLTNMPHPSFLNYAFILVNEMESATKNKLSLRPKDERYLNFLAYFSQLIDTQHTSLLSVVPYRVRLDDLFIATNVIVKEDFILKAINGKVVALCQHLNRYDRNNEKVFVLSDKVLVCYGHGLIRGVDWEEGILYIITPLPNGTLGRVNALLYADWVPELMGQENQLPKGTVVPYRTMTQDQHKQLMIAPRRRFNPLQLLKMARNS